LCCDTWLFEECDVKKKGSKIIEARYQMGGTVLTSHVFELRGQLPIFFLQRKEVLHTFDKSLTTG
jgi:hypothetical protein